MGPQWSPHGRRLPPGGAPYMPPAPPSTPPSLFRGQGSSRGSPHAREGRYRGKEGSQPPQQQQKPNYGPCGPAMGKKELNFPSDCVEGISISTTKRRKMTSKDLAPFEAWRLMLALKSGLLAESTWALDTMSILLHDDNTYGYFSLATLPGLLEVLCEHFRHALIHMFPDNGFHKLEPPHTPPSRSKQHQKQQQHGNNNNGRKGDNRSLQELVDMSEESAKVAGEPLRMFNITGTNYTKVSRKGLPVKFDDTHSDPSVMDAKEWDVCRHFDTEPDHWLAGCGDFTDHIVTHLESSNTNSFLSRKFRKKRTWSCMGDDDEGKKGGGSDDIAKRVRKYEKKNSVKCGARDSEGRKVSRSKPLDAGCETADQNSNTDRNHSSVCNGIQNNDQLSVLVKQEVKDESYNKSLVNGDSDTKSSESNVNCESKDKEIKSNYESNSHIDSKKGKENNLSCSMNGSLENGDIEEPKLSPMVNCEQSKGTKTEKAEKLEDRKDLDCDPSSPPVLKAECCSDDQMEVDSKTTSVHELKTEESKTPVVQISTQDIKSETTKEAASILDNTFDELIYISESETEKLSASIVAEMLKEDEQIEDEAFQRDDAPLAVTPESQDELGRRCVCISNIVRSLSYVPGNELKLSSHAGTLRLLGELLLLHHSHPRRPPPHRLPSEDEEEDEEDEVEALPRVYDSAHWWWDYLEALRENVLVTLTNIGPYLRLGGLPEPVVRPLLEGLLHWVVCPASVARDPMASMGPAGRGLSPHRLALEALTKLCIQEENVDLVLAVRPQRCLLLLYSTLVQLLADRLAPIQREFSIVMLSFIVAGESGAARAVALQAPVVSLLIDFLETAEQSALTIANTQGVEVLQSSPEVMGTSLDMLRRAAAILLHLARVPDNRKLFTAQQPRLLNLVMSQILDQTVSNTLSQVLFECSAGS